MLPPGATISARKRNGTHVNRRTMTAAVAIACVVRIPAPSVDVSRVGKPPYVREKCTRPRDARNRPNLPAVAMISHPHEQQQRSEQNHLLDDRRRQDAREEGHSQGHLPFVFLRRE